jgi:hypothetical protein
MLVVTLGRPALVTEVPALAKVRAVVNTLLCRMESCGVAVDHQQGRRALAPEALAPPSLVLTAVKKRTCRHAPEKPLAVEPAPAAAVGRRAGAGSSVSATVETTPRKWCPLHETSLHDVTACCYIRHLVEIHRERLAKHAAVGVTHGCHECGHSGHWLHGCPGKVILREDQEAEEKARWEPSQGAVHTAASREGLPGDEAIA